MNIKAKCACSAEVELMGVAHEHWEDARVMETFKRWVEAHRACATLKVESVTLKIADASEPAPG